MTLNEIKKLVLEHKLILVKTPTGIKRTRRYVWDKNWNITGVKKFEYQSWICRAEYPDNNSGFRISQKVWKELSEELSDCVSCTDNIIKQNDSNKV